MFLTNCFVQNKNKLTRLINPKQINLYVCRPLQGLKLKPPFQDFELDPFSWKMYHALYSCVLFNLYVKKR